MRDVEVSWWRVGREMGVLSGCSRGLGRLDDLVSTSEVSCGGLARGASEGKVKSSTLVKSSSSLVAT